MQLGEELNGDEKVLRYPVKLMLIFGSIWSALLGVHGFYIYFTRPSQPFGKGLDCLFLGWKPPLGLSETVSWASTAGLHSWFMPLFLLVLGLVIWNLQAKIRWPRVPSISRLVKKFHLW